MEDNFKKWLKVVVDSSNDTGLVTLNPDLHNLLPDHDYRVRISATNDQSEGPVSAVVKFSTESGGKFN